MDDPIDILNERDKVAAPRPVTGSGGALLKRLRPFAVATFLLALAFSGPLLRLVKLALDDKLYSHILLIPFVSLYLVWSDREKLLKDVAPAGLLKLIPILAGAVMWALYAWFIHAEARWGEINYLAAAMVWFLVCLLRVCDEFLGRKTLRAILFPVGFLIFMVPFPIALRTGIETFMQHTSAITAEWFLRLSGMPVIREHFLLRLPAFEMQVAPECSGIHSSLVLLITSCVAGYLFLRKPWKRAVLALAVLPLAILRNGFRIFVIGQLCVRIGPQMIDSPIHHQGGPLFFGLSLIPFFFLLLFLYKSDRAAGSTKPPQPGT